MFDFRSTRSPWKRQSRDDSRVLYRHVEILRRQPNSAEFYHYFRSITFRINRVKDARKSKFWNVSQIEIEKQSFAAFLVRNMGPCLIDAREREKLIKKRIPVLTFCESTVRYFSSFSFLFFLSRCSERLVKNNESNIYNYYRAYYYYHCSGNRTFLSSCNFILTWVRNFDVLTNRGFKCRAAVPFFPFNF